MDRPRNYAKRSTTNKKANKRLKRLAKKNGRTSKLGKIHTEGIRIPNWLKRQLRG